MEEILKNLVTDTVTDAVTNAGIEAIPDPSNEEAIDFILSVPPDAGAEELAWGVADIMIDTGAGDALLALTGGPVVLVLAYKVFKRWRKNIRQKQMMGKA